MNKSYILAVTLPLLFLGACKGDEKKGAESKQQDTPIVKTMVVNDREVNQLGRYTATVEPEIINNITSSAPNRIKQILVDEGMM
ncbi:MAG: efflux transporter periplasmic adaptor subunit, partial [Muribaculaceae bacterium]|nr:efflux transporter periplasmic adaptor subunit [Muribaculaceae bacterium]